MRDDPLLDALDEGLWILRTPLRFFVEMGRVMTVVDVGTGRLLVHSPAALTDPIRRQLDALGEVRYVVPASNLHGHLFMEQYAAAYPGVELFAAPRLQGKRSDLRFAGELGTKADPRWSTVLDQAVLRGHRFYDEILFLHRPSRTLIVGDAIFNPPDSAGLFLRLWVRGPSLRPRAATPLGLRPGFSDKAALNASIDHVLEWDFDRIVVGHGELIETGGKDVLRRAYAWAR